MPMLDFVLHFHYFMGDRFKGIMTKFRACTKLTEVTNTWKARTRIQNDLNKLYKPHVKNMEQIQGYILRGESKLYCQQREEDCLSTDMTKRTVSSG